MRRVSGSARIAPPSLIARLIGGQFVLSMEGQDVAAITSKSVSADAKPFTEAVSLRVTVVDFQDGEQWQIHGVPRGPTRWRTTRTGKQVGAHPIEERTVKVDESSRTVAETVNPFTRHQPWQVESVIEVEAEGEIYSLSQGDIGDSGTIKQVGKRVEWLIEARRPLPLSVALLYWHLVTGEGDWRPAESYSSGG